MNNAARLTAGGHVRMKYKVHQEVWTSSMTNEAHIRWITEILWGRSTVAAAIDVS